MWERILMAALIVGAGVLAYRLFLQVQRRRAARGSLARAATGRSAVLVFTSPTCASCKLQQLPILERILVDWRDKIEVEIIDVTERPEVATRYGVWSLPTTIVLDEQRTVIAINQGVAHERKLREQLGSTSAGESAQAGEWASSHLRASAN
ncbi:Thioredoxin [Thermoflexales bacterium]|nr:Thioredoxin [Thermoflexales bacterium]